MPGAGPPVNVKIVLGEAVSGCRFTAIPSEYKHSGLFPRTGGLTEAMSRRTALIALMIRGIPIVLVVVGFGWLGYWSGDPWLVVPAAVTAAGIGVVSFWKRKHPLKRYAARSQFEGFLRFSTESKWQFGLATPSRGSLAFQPRWKNSRQDKGDVHVLSVKEMGSSRPPTLVEAVFRIYPTAEVLELRTSAGSVELAGHPENMQRTLEIVAGRPEGSKAGR